MAHGNTSIFNPEALIEYAHLCSTWKATSVSASNVNSIYSDHIVYEERSKDQINHEGES